MILSSPVSDPKYTNHPLLLQTKTHHESLPNSDPASSLSQPAKLSL